MTKTIGAWTMVTMLTLLLATAASGESKEGVDVILEKDRSAMTITFEKAGVVHVEPTTLMYGSDGSPISFDSLPSATQLEPGMVELPDEGVSYRIYLAGRTAYARELRVVEGLVR